MKLDAIQSVAQEKLEAELKPISDQLSRFRAVLDAYEGILRDDIERRVYNTILVALGQPEKPASQHGDLEDLERARAALREALNELSAAIEPATTPRGSLVEPAPSQVKEDWFEVPHTTAEKPAPSRPAPLPKKVVTSEDIEEIKRLLGEVAELRKTFKSQHPARLSPLLQALAAETRIFLERLPIDHFYAERLNETVQTIGRIRLEGGVKDFIKGLAYGSHASWHSLAASMRRKVEQFDKDAETPPMSTRKAAPPSMKKQPPEPAPATNHTWPELPHLRKLSKPIVLAGGMFIPEKVNSIYERFGLKVDWHAIDHDNPKAAGTLLPRIRGGKIGVLVLVEGFMRHDAFKPIADACSTSSVPMSYCGKAGIASLASAFEELEKKLATRKEGAA